jgi:hypothetical protein
MHAFFREVLRYSHHTHHSYLLYTSRLHSACKILEPRSAHTLVCCRPYFEWKHALVNLGRLDKRSAKAFSLYIFSFLTRTQCTLPIC